MAIRDITMLVNLPCEKASRLASASLDRPLSRSERWALRVHTFVCGNCHRALRQLQLLHTIASKMPEAAQRQFRAALPQLSVVRKQRVKQLLADARRADG